jgi:hypothetical protein
MRLEEAVDRNRIPSSLRPQASGLKPQASRLKPDALQARLAPNWLS